MHNTIYNFSVKTFRSKVTQFLCTYLLWNNSFCRVTFRVYTCVTNFYPIIISISWHILLLQSKCYTILYMYLLWINFCVYTFSCANANLEHLQFNLFKAICTKCVELRYMCAIWSILLCDNLCTISSSWSTTFNSILL